MAIVVYTTPLNVAESCESEIVAMTEADEINLRVTDGMKYH